MGTTGKVQIMEDERICLTCKNKKPIGAFSKSNKSRCKTCYNTYKQGYDARHPEKIRAINRRSYLKNRDKRVQGSIAYAKRKRKGEG